MTSSVKIFVINLKRSTERREHMIREMGRLELDWKFVEAVDGQTLSASEIDAHGMDVVCPWSFMDARRLMRGEIGCLMSHLGIYRRMVDMGIEQAFIFEDDCEFDRGLGALLKSGKLLRWDWDLLLLGHWGLCRARTLGAECVVVGDDIIAGHRLARPREAALGTYAYAIKKSAAAMLLRHAYPLRMPMDFLTGHSPALGLQLRVVTPPLAMIKNGNPFHSTIYPDRHVVTHLTFRGMRRFKRMLGDRCHAFKTVNRLVRRWPGALLVALTKAGLRADDAYVEKRLFHCAPNALRVPSPELPTAPAQREAL